MFDTDVDKVLAEGQDYVTRLNTAVEKAKVRAEGKQKEIDRIIAERNELDHKAKRGSIVSQRFATLLTVTDEDLEKE